MLPTELNEGILDHLTDEPHTLAMCARAHRSLLTLAHQRLFADIRINFDWQAASSRPAQLLAALNASPYLGTYVRRFTVSCEGASFRICAHIPGPNLHLFRQRWSSARLLDYLLHRTTLSAAFASFVYDTMQTVTAVPVLVVPDDAGLLAHDE